MADRLSAAELERLPRDLALRYWAGLLGEGCPGLTPVTLAAAIADCRAWFALTASDTARCVFGDLAGKSVTILSVDPAFDFGGGHVGELLTVTHPSLVEPIGLSREHLRAIPPQTGGFVNNR